MLIAGAILHSRPSRDRVLRLVTSKAADAGFILHADTLDYNLFTLSARLSGVTVARPGAADTPFLSVDELRASVPWGAITGRFGLDRVEIVSPRVVLRRDQSGHDNWTSDRPTSSTEGPTTVHIGRLIVSNLSVDWTDEQRSVHADAELSIDLAPDGSATSGPIVMTRPANVRWRDRAVSIAGSGGRLSWNDRDLAVDSLSLSAAEGTVRLDARVTELLGAAHVDARADLSADLDALSPWLGLARPLAGTAQAAVRVDAGGVEVTTVRARLAGGDVAGGARASFSGAGTLHLTWDRLELSDLLQRLIANPPGVLPSSQAAGSLDAQWTAPQLDALRLTMNGRLRGNRAPNRRTDVPVDATLKLALRDRKFTVSAEPVDVLGGHAMAALEGTLDANDLVRSAIAGTLQVRANAEGADWGAMVRAGWIDAVPAVRGDAAADFRVSGTAGAPLLDGDVDATVRYESMPAATVRSHASLSADAVGLSGIDARMGGAAARGDVRWSIASSAIAGALNGSVPLQTLDDFSSPIPTSLALNGSVNLAATLSGTIVQPRVALHAAGRALEISGQTIDSLAADVRVAGSDLALERVLVQQDGGRIEAAGTFNLTRDTYEAHATATDVWLHPVIEVNGEADASMAGRLNATFDGAGTLANLGGRGRVSIADARWGSADVGLVGADFTLAGRIATFSFDARDLALAGHGTVGVDPSGPLTVSATWEPGDAAAIARRFAFNVPVSGSAALAVEWTGTRDRPGDGRGSISLNRADLTISSQRLTLAQPGRIDVEGRAVQVTPLVLSTGASSITVDGAISNAQPGRVSVTIDGSLADFGFVRDLIQAPADAAAGPPLTGSLNVQLSAEGTAANPRITGTLRVGGGRVAVTDGHDVTDIELGAHYDNGVLVVDRATTLFEGASLSATARVPGSVFADLLPASIRGYLAAASGPATLSAQLRSVSQAIAAPWVDATTLEQIGLRADASIDLETDRPALDALRGTVVLSRAELSLAGASLDQEIPTRLAIGNGRVTIDAFRLGKGDNQVALEGGVTISGDPALDLSAKGALDLRMLNAVVPTARTVGRGDFGIRVGGTGRAPTVDGYLTLSSGETRMADPRLVVADVNGTISFRGDTITFERLSATMNGGDAELSGSLRLQGPAALDGSVTLSVKDAALDIAGLRAESDAALTWTVNANGPALGGTVTLLRSGYRERLSLTGSLLSALRASPAVQTPGNSLLDRTRLDVHVVTDEDLVIDNNMARLTLSGDLRAVGTLSKPSLTGRATLGEGGQIFFNGTRYRIADQGSIDFANPNRIEPDLNVSAVASVQGNEITLTLKGTPATLEASLDSDNKDLSQSDLVSLLLIGRTANASDASSVGSDQLVGLLASGFLDAAGRVVGLDTVRVERGTPDVRLDAGLVAAETDPGARLTFGKQIGSHWDVVFSQSLQQSGGLTWIVGYKPRSGIDLRVVSLDGGDRLYTFSHDLTLGGPARKTTAASTPAPRVSGMDVRGAGADEAAIRSRLKLQTGDRFSFFQWQDDRERLEAFYWDRQRLEARVVTRRAPDPGDAAHLRLAYKVRPGPLTTVVVDGFQLSKSGTTAIAQAWERSIADDFLIDETVAAARADLADAGYLLPSVTARMETDGDAKRLRVVIAPGPRTGTRRVEFSGNAGQPADRLLAVLSDRGLTQAVWTSPNEVRDALTAFYRANGYLKATVKVEAITVSGSAAILPIRIDEGTASHVASVHIDGVRAMTPEEAARVVGLSAGDGYTEARLEKAQRALDAQYRARGYNRVSIDYQVRTVETDAASRAATDVDVVVRVDEGPQQRLREVVTSGVSRTRPGDREPRARAGSRRASRSRCLERGAAARVRNGRVPRR